jgi:hypothetical protein
VFGGTFEIPQTYRVHFTSNDITNITDTSVVCSSNIKSYNDFPILEKGFCWSTSPNPTIDDNKAICTSDSFTLEISNLTPTTTYHIKPYAINEYGVSYGEERPVGTATGKINGHYYVDLGLPSGIKWAVDNVNISGSKLHGDYFAWGETSPKNEYTKENSLTQGLDISELQSQGYVDENGNLTPEHDAATVNWGGSWRMPTKAEYDELINKKYYDVYNDSIFTLKGPSGGSIYYYTDGNSDGDNSIAWYYTSTANGTNTYSGQLVPKFNVKQQGYFSTRYKGYYIRPVSV